MSQYGGEPDAPGSLGTTPSRRLEAGPEAGLALQGGGLAGTALEAGELLVTVRQLGQVLEAPPQNPDVPRQTDIKVGIEGPLPVPANFVHLGLVNLAREPRVDPHPKRLFQQGGVQHAPIHVKAHKLMPFGRLDLHPWGNPQVPGVRIGRADPQLRADPQPLIKGVRDPMAALDPRTSPGADRSPNRLGYARDRGLPYPLKACGTGIIAAGKVGTGIEVLK